MRQIRNKKTSKGWILLQSALLSVFLLMAGADPAAAADGGHYFIYYLNYEETALESMPYIPSEETGEFMLQDLMIRLNERERSTQGSSLLPGEVQINSFTIEGQTLNLEFNEAYLQMKPGREILTRAGIVRTFLQIPQITGVRIMIGREELTDHQGDPVGIMNLSDFVDISGSDSDPYRYDSFSLYFTDKKGKKLLEETRNVYYRRSIPRERVILEQLAKGPMEKEHYPTIPENTVVNSVRVFDRVCYVDLGSTFVDYALSIREKTIAASVANSLIAGGAVDEVQIRVEGDDHARLGDLSLYRFFKWNEELLPVEEE
ncbi:MAG: GerMN domain-containing protein [Blautia sp.]|nr:GerMN domain-containing protein [Blautia sp.]